MAYNIKPGMPKEQGDFPSPTQPGEEVLIDMLTPEGGYRYLLMMIDTYTGWIEAVPTKHEDAKSVIKALVNVWIPNHGFPRKIRSDNGSHFTAKDLSEAEQMMGLQHCFGAVYHPQSQGAVERANRTMKQKMAKCCEETGLNWMKALPIVLLSLRSEVNKGHGFSPYELTRGYPMPGPIRSGTLAAPANVDRKKYFDQLKSLLSSLHPQADAEELYTHVYLKVIKRKGWSNPRWEGPFRITARTTYAFKLEGKGNSWWHKTQCTPAKPGQAPKKEDV